MASAYLTLAQFDAHLTGDLKQRSDNAQQQVALDGACAEADSYLRSGGYALPVANDDAPADVKGRVANIARYHLAVVLGLVPEPANASAVWMACKAAREWLQDVAKGVIALDLALETEGEGPGEAYVVTQAGRHWGDGW